MGSVVGSVIGTAVGGPIGGQIGGAIGGRLDKKKAASGAQQAANREADLAYQRSLPIGVGGMFGDVSYDEATRQMSIAADPRLQAEYDIALQDPARQRAFRAELEADPYAAGKNSMKCKKNYMLQNKKSKDLL